MLKEMTSPIKRLEAVKTRKNRADMGDVLADFMAAAKAGRVGPGYSRDSGLYDY